MQKASPDRQISACQTRIAHLAGLEHRTATSEQAILDRAHARTDEVDADLAKLRPRVDLDPTAADSYQALTLERGQLAIIIAHAEQALAS